MTPKEDPPQSKRVRRSPAARGRKTGLRLEDALWKELRAMADERNVSVAELVDSIDVKRNDLSSAIRQLLLKLRRERR